MPEIEKIPEVLYGPNDPIHWEYDNLPLKAILDRIDLINLAVDNVISQITDAIGTQGSISNRLNQSIDQDGNLKTEAINAALHTMDDHTDTDNYVRMTKVQSDKLDLVQDEATNLVLQVYTNDTNYVEFNTGTVVIKPSITVTPTIDSPNVVKMNMAFPVEAAHRHYYAQTPVSVNQISPDFINYKVNTLASAYVEGSLRIYINGVRLFADAEVYVPGALATDAWTLIAFTEDHANGLFELSSAITDQDIIRVDFDISLV